MKKYNHRFKYLANSGKSKFKERIAAVIVTSILCLSVMPVSALAADAPIRTAAAAGTSDTAATTKTAKVPSADSIHLNVKSAVLIEPTTGEILLSINADEAFAPASMTKMMTEYIVADKVKKGKISWNDVVTVSENASKSIGSRIFLAEGDTHTVKELYTAMAVGSANDATVALAEYVAGSELNFVKLMNEEAKRMGMTKTHFINSTGLNRADMPEGFRPEGEGETLMSARDVATLAKYIINDDPNFADFSSIQFYKFRKTDKDAIVNSDWMLEANKKIPNLKQYAYEGLDGLKTGYTQDAGYCFAGTAERNGMRLISVVMGTKSMGGRFKETKKVLDYGFDNFKVKQMVAAGSKVTGAETSPVIDGKETEVPLVTESAVNFVVPKAGGLLKPTVSVNLNRDGLTAPVEPGAKAGTATFTYHVEGMSSVQKQTVNLISEQKVEKAGWFILLLRSIGHFFGNLFDGIKHLF